MPRLHPAPSPNFPPPILISLLSISKSLRGSELTTARRRAIAGVVLPLPCLRRLFVSAPPLPQRALSHAHPFGRYHQGSGLNWPFSAMHVMPELTGARGRAGNPFSPSLSFVFCEPRTLLYLLELVHALSSIAVAGNGESAAMQPSPLATAVGKAAPLHLWRHSYSIFFASSQ
jgi:hypothetical protein